MNKEIRIKKLKEIQTTEPYTKGIPVPYRGDNIKLDAWKIPLKYLIYNKYNGRIGSMVKSFEKQYHELNPEDESHVKLIEQFLWASKEDRNENTMNDIAEKGQRRFGMVTSDGVIIDGNRRAMLLNTIFNDRDKWKKKGKNVNFAEYFIAVILPEDASPKEIQQLETTYQMGEDEKLDYNPIEKYLKIKDLKKYGFTESDVAQMMGEKPSKIKEWVQILELMEKYLKYMDYEGIFTRLDKTEGQFVDLNNYVNRYKDKKSKKIQWNYDDLDVSEMMGICFDYIRARYEGKDFRKIAQPSAKDSIFCKSRELWQDFANEHKEKVGIVKEKSVLILREENKGEDLSKVLSARDKEWTDKVKDNLTGNLNKHYNRVQDLNDADRPAELADKALKSLEAINTDAQQFHEDKDVYDILKRINGLTYQYMKKIK